MRLRPSFKESSNIKFVTSFYALTLGSWVRVGKWDPLDFSMDGIK